MTRSSLAAAADPSLAAFERERPQLFAIAYRMLGSVREAEDVLQDAYIRWHAVDIARVDRPGAYLVRLVTRLCIDLLRSARARRLEYVGPWLPEPLVQAALDESDGADPTALHDRADDLSVAFLLMLERLSPVERAIFLLRESFEMSYAEIAGIVGRSEANCRQIEKRARARLADADRARPADPDEHDRLLRQFMRATREGDVDGLIALLAGDVVAYGDGGGRVTSARRPIRGTSNVARYFVGLAGRVPPDTVFRLTTINGRTGVLTFMGGRLHSVLSVHVESGRISRLYSVLNPDKLPGVRGADSSNRDAPDADD